MDAKSSRGDAAVDCDVAVYVHGTYSGDVEVPVDYFALAQDLLLKSLPRRWVHVQAVAARAQQACQLFDQKDAHLLASAALVHDIGYAPQVVDTGFHALDGARYLAANDLPERLCALMEYHSCAYCEAELRGLSAELPRAS